MTDAEAFDAMKAGNQEGLKVLYERCREKCLRYAYKNLRTDTPQTEAMDLYQEAILILWENVKSGRLVELWVQPATYLIQVMRNLWLKQQRQLTRPLLTAPPEIDDEDHADLIRQKVRRALSKIDEKCRGLLTFRYFDKLSYESIVTLTDYTSADAIRNVIVRCRKKLRNSYKKEPDLPYQPNEDIAIADLDGLTEEE